MIVNIVIWWTTVQVAYSNNLSDYACFSVPIKKWETRSLTATAGVWWIYYAYFTLLK
jgi:hypothetical protein